MKRRNLRVVCCVALGLILLGTIAWANELATLTRYLTDPAENASPTGKGGESVPFGASTQN